MLFLTGPTAAGKNTVANLVAQSINRCAIVDYDLIRRMFVKPHLPPWAGEEGLAQHRLGAKLVSDVALGFQRAGWTVIVLDVITNQVFPVYKKMLSAVPVTIIQLLPSLEENVRRFYERGPVLTHEEFLYVYETQVEFRHADQRIDTTLMTAEEVAGQIVQYLQ